MEYWLKAKLYLVGKGNLVSNIENFVHLTRKCRSFIKNDANDYNLIYLKNIRSQIYSASVGYKLAVRYLGFESIFSKTAGIAETALCILDTKIKEMTPIVNNKSRKQKRQEKARLNRSYGKGKNR